jgi:hypothetical protein
MAQSSREIYWSAILADFRRSGLTHVEFCRLRRISIHSFRDWLYRLRPGLPPRRSRAGHTSPTPSSTQADLPASLPVHTSSTPSPTQADLPAFLPVHVRPRPLAPISDHQVAKPPAPLELVLSDRCHLRVPAGFDPATLHQLLDVLEERS